MPMDRARYPDDWEQISRRVRFERAGGRCECRGECGHAHLTEFDRCDDAEYGCEGCDGRGRGDCGAVMTPGRCDARHGEAHPVTGSRVVLTVAHLDHDTTHNDDANLRAMCQRCHLALDADLHRRNARETLRSRRAAGDLFDDAEVPHA